MQNLIQFIISPNFEGWLLALKIVMIVLSLVLLVGFIIFFRKASWFRRLVLEDTVEFFTFRPYGVKTIEKIWSKIMARLNTGLESEYKLAIIEAESLLDDTLQRMGYKGDSLGERLKNITSLIIPNIQDVLQAHQVHNNIVHDPDYRLSLDGTKKTLAIYEKTFQDLQLF